MKETQEERGPTLAYNNPWVLNYAHQHNINKTPQRQTNKKPNQNRFAYLLIAVLYVWISF